MSDSKEASKEEAAAAAADEVHQDAGQLLWSQPETKGEDGQPSKRSGHTISMIGSNLFMFGGLNADGKPGPTDELWCLKTQGDAFEWTLVDPDGEVPLARWKHTATVWGTQIVVFGGFHSSTNRSNDTFVFDTVSLSWSRPIDSQGEFTPRGNHMPTKNAWPFTPSPRGAHSATLMGDVVYIFGGYGGQGYGRRDFNGMFALDLTDWTWSKVQCRGKPPEPRSSHTANRVEERIFVHGGWNSVQQFNDLHIFDTKTITWSQTDVSSTAPPCWNHGACAVEAIPNWKLFVFGGCSGELGSKSAQGSYRNEVQVLDTGSMVWNAPQVECLKGEAPPHPRSDCDLVYDAKGSRIFLFGGWANRWFDDLHILDVGSVVGPPYAIMGIQPKIGPITGGQEISIEGLDFVKTTQVLVRFSSRTRGGQAEVQGEYVSSTMLKCLSPSFLDIGSGQVDVRVSLNGDSYTTTYQKYSFFAVTDASKCICFGPGIIPGGAPGIETVFVIQAVDSTGTFRDTGGDEFDIVVRSVTTAGVVESEITDQEDGKYLVTFTLPDADSEFEISVVFKGTFGGKAGHLRGSPYTVQADEDAGRDKNSMTGPLVMDSIRKEVAELAKFARQTDVGLKAKVPEDNLAALLKMKEHLHNATARKGEIDLAFDRSRAVIEYLKGEGASMGRMLDSLQNARNTWQGLQKQVPVTRAAIAPQVKVQAAKTKVDIAEYEQQVAAYLEAFRQLEFWKYEAGPEGARRLIDEAEVVHKERQAECDDKQHLANMFECAILMEGSQSMMSEVQQNLEWARDMWDAFDGFLTYQEECASTLWKDAEADAMEEETRSLMKSIKACKKDIKWCDAYKQGEAQAKAQLRTWPLISALHHPSMRQRHWEALMEKTQRNFTPPNEEPQLELGEVLALGLHEFASDVEEICDQAQKEEKIETNLRTLEATWKSIEFEKQEHVKKGKKDADEDDDDGAENVVLLKMLQDDFEQLENDQLLVQAMMGSRYLRTFERAVNEWNVSLGVVGDVVQALVIVQRTWSYLEPLFIGSAEVKRELPEDTARFAKIDVDTKNILRSCGEISNVLRACTQEGLLESLERISEELAQCKKSLQDFLDGKRQQFPRFYFVSEADLLDLLSNASQPANIMKHVTKVFLAVKTFKLTEFGEGARPAATGWISEVGQEEVVFEPAVPLEGKAEVYLQKILNGMRGTLKNRLRESAERYPTQERTRWLTDKTPDDQPTDPAQISLLTSSVYYARNVETAFSAMGSGNPAGLRDFNAVQKQQLAELIKLTQQEGMSKGERRRVMCMITLDAHNRDLIEKLIREGVSDAGAFQWQSQLRARWDDPKARLQIADANFDYGYEYLGNGSRLVITPLTDRIYVTATQALHLNMGCAPAGPAGTGKTETTKDLASALGKICYVINCSPEMDYMSMGNIFKGLAASGAWGCFDEFNRLKSEVLSVCTVQFKAVCDGMRANAPTATIEGDTVDLDATCGVFITMNPGYLGRSTLPEGLKALFRPITVMVPDLILICENMLMAEGFTSAKILARKFYGLYSLLKDLLSPQAHYDWGLRAVKSVLVVAGVFKRASPTTPEEHILMRALRDFNTPKIVQADEIIFFGLLRDLFPGVDPPRNTDAEVEEAVRQACAARKMWPDDAFVRKNVELDELLAIRHCVFVMGAPGSGKSECWKTLAAAKTALGWKTTTRDINPKAITPEELYGYISFKTREWKDGVLSQIMRTLGQVDDNDPKWMVLDGDLDANWIESMNSVMDDNRMLTLASNERIPLKSNMRMVFEIRDLDFATPATVSRAGILYISDDDGSQWRALVASWVQKLPEVVGESARESLGGLFELYCGPVLLHIKKNLKTLVTIPEITMVQSLLNMLGSLLKDNLGLVKGDDPAAISKKIEPMFVFCCIWGFGSCMAERDGRDFRQEFSEYWRKTWKTVRIPSRETVFDYYLSTETNTLEPFKNSSWFYTVEYDSAETNMQSVTVPTPETASIAHWMEKLVLNSKPTMLVGPAGCGKTQMVRGLVSKFKPEERQVCTINFNFFTNAELLQKGMEAPLEKKTGSNYGPIGQARLVYFLDDLNLPEVDPYNTQSAIALIRQHRDYGHWFDMSKDDISVKNIRRCQYLACMNNTAGSFEINPRLQRHFTTLAIGFPGPTSLLTIYQTFLDGHLKRFSPEVQSLSSNLINAALVLHSGCVKAFRKTAKNFHYEFNLRHLSNVFQGLLTASPSRFDDPSKFVQLWLHESERVYGDLLVSKSDLGRYMNEAQAQSKRRFPAYNMAKFFASENADILLFCHFADGVESIGNIGAGGDDEEGGYDQVLAIENVGDTLEAALVDYNESNVTMNLVLFDDAVRHVCRITRIVSNPGGHALLVGVGGSGKRSLTKLAGHMCGYALSMIKISSGYSLNDFKTDLQTMYRRAGVKDEGILFLFLDGQIVDERFLVFMNDLLASGEIPDLFAPEDVDAITSDVVGKVKAAGLPTDRKSCWTYFLNVVRKNLHVVLSFSPVSEDFRIRARRFPALVTCTSIDWFHPWPFDALLSVGRQFLQDVDLGEDVREGIENFMPFSFQVVNDMCTDFLERERRQVYTTPKSYLELLKLYGSLLKEKRAKYAKATSRLNIGLERMRSSAEAVTKIETELKGMLERAEEKKEKAEGIAEVVEGEKRIVETEEAKAREEAAKCAVIKEEVSRIQADAEEDLKAAEPLVIQAMAALDTLDKKEIGECKTMIKAPSGVDDVFAAILVLMAGKPAESANMNIITQKTGKVKDRSWDASKKALLSNVNNFLDSLKSYKVHVDNFTVPRINWKEVRPYLALEHFNVQAIEAKNRAAAGLCAWVVNIVKYHDTIVSVEPKRQALSEANARLAAANEKLGKVNAHVADLAKKLKVLTDELDAANAQKKEAVDSCELAQTRLDLAQRLTGALGSEKVRWAENITQIEENEQYLSGDVLLASAFISYIGPFTKKYRDALIHEHWVPFMHSCGGKDDEGLPLGIPLSPEANPLAVITDDAEVAKWRTQTLPADRVSTENGAIVMSSGRWPLLVDPQLQGIHWLKSMFKDSGLDVVRVGSKDIMRKVETAIREGRIIIVENMLEDGPDAPLMPVVSRSLLFRGGRKFYKLGEEEIEVHENFKFFLHTKLANPHYAPEIHAETTMVNFTVTQQGLEDQLLSLVVQKERSDLAQQRSYLIEQNNQFKVKLQALEDLILQKLADAEGDVTTDVELIESLEDAKKTSNDIKKKMDIAVETEREINITSEKYRDVAKRGSLLFFVMNDLFRIHSFYMYSLNAFVVIFMRGIDLVSSGGGGSKGKGSLMSRFKKAAKKIINTKRFSWNQDILHEMQAASSGAGMNLGDIQAKAKLAATNNSLTDEQVATRCKTLNGSITKVVFNYLRRGLFDKDKLMVATQLVLKVLHQAGTISSTEIDAFLMPGPHPDPHSRGATLSEWMSQEIWAACRNLEEINPDVYKHFGDELQTDFDWREWFELEKPESEPMPGNFAELGGFHRLLVLRIMRPDRLTAELSKFVEAQLGPEFVKQPAFDIGKAIDESSPSTPIFFTLFPGVDPTTWIETYATKTMTGKQFLNISMGQGQEERAESKVHEFAESGGWIFLQNVHLMQAWLPRLERTLEEAADGSHADFRCFISAEPPPLPHFKTIPESLLQSCIKVMNEAPSDLQSNLRRAWSAFDEERIASSDRPNDFKACLFALSFFHALVLGRRKFGQQGWSRKYSFNTGDLTICSDICGNYIGSHAQVPWEDMRYIFGEIMYGGHITDFWDRRTNRTYLSVLLNPSLMRGGDLVPCSETFGQFLNPDGDDGEAPAPLFPSPDPSTTSKDAYTALIEDALPLENPILFGMHPNAEIGYLTGRAHELCSAILALGGSKASNGAATAETGKKGAAKSKAGESKTKGGSGKAAKAKGAGGAAGVSKLVRTLEMLMEQLPQEFNMVEVQERASPKLKTEDAPHVLVALQEATNMNTLIEEIRTSLDTLQKGQNGELNMTEPMEDLASALSIDQVPGRNPLSKASWEKYAWWSKKQLLPWFADMILRYQQIVAWTNEMETPVCLWLSGLFNPTAFNTAIMQVTARRDGLPLDNMTIATAVTAMSKASEVTDVPPGGGRYVHGMFLEGAAWMHDEEECEDYDVNGVTCRGYLIDAQLKELLPVMPVMYIRAVAVDPAWEASEVGYLRNDRSTYECPVYTTTFRGPTFVFLATLKVEDGSDANQWILRAAALITQSD